MAIEIPEHTDYPIKESKFIFPNYQDYGYGIFLLDEKSRAYVLANIQNEKDDFLRTMMWGALWDSVRETELESEGLRRTRHQKHQRRIGRKHDSNASRQSFNRDELLL